MEIEQHNAAQMYKETSIKTADAGKLIVLLYEEIIKHLKEAIVLLTTSDFKAYDQVTHHITKAQEIITELTTALSKKESVELYDNLFSIYLYFNKTLSEANIKKDHTLILPIQTMVEELLESWQQISSQTIKSPKKQTGINLSG